MKGIVIGIAIFLAVIFWAMHFAGGEINKQEREELTQGCVLESIGNAKFESEMTTRIGQSLIFRGWVADTGRGNVPTTIDVLLVNKDRIEAVVGSGKPTIDRPDVVSTFRKSGILKSGFEIPATISVPRLGSWDVRLREKFQDRISTCYSDKVLQVNE